MDLSDSPVLFWSEEHTTGATPNGMAQIEWRTTWSGELQYRVWAACNSMLRATSCRAGSRSDYEYGTSARRSPTQRIHRSYPTREPDCGRGGLIKSSRLILVEDRCNEFLCVGPLSCAKALPVREHKQFANLSWF